MLPQNYAVEQMNQAEVSQLAEWAREEGWNPGRSDLALAWDFDPKAFIALREGRELVGGGTILSYGGLYGFMGLFIMRKDKRGLGLGRELWLTRRDLLKSRLQPNASIGMDGVFNMAAFYQRGGFEFAHRDLRFQGLAKGLVQPDLVNLNSVPFNQLAAFDSGFVPAPRAEFLQAWIQQPDAIGLALLGDQGLKGYGLARPCQQGFKIGPLFAHSALEAEQILLGLLAEIAGEQVQIDIPEPNQPGLALAAKCGLEESFGCARMYLGSRPNLPLEQIFGLTSFEFG